MSFYSQLLWILLNSATIISQLLMITLAIKILGLSKTSDSDPSPKANTCNEASMEATNDHPTTVPPILQSLPPTRSFKPGPAELENVMPKCPSISHDTATEGNSIFLQDLIPYTSNGDDEPYPKPRSPCNHSHTFPNCDTASWSSISNAGATRRHTSDTYVGSGTRSGKSRKNIRFVAKLREWNSFKGREVG